MLEYTAPVWHHSLNTSQKNQIEAIQKRAIRIIYSCACDMPYTSGVLYLLLDWRTQTSAGIYCHTISSNLFYQRHRVYIIYFCNLVILNYFLALGLLGTTIKVKYHTQKYIILCTVFTEKLIRLRSVGKILGYFLNI